MFSCLLSSCKSFSANCSPFYEEEELADRCKELSTTKRANHSRWWPEQEQSTSKGDSWLDQIAQNARNVRKHWMFQSTSWDPLGVSEACPGRSWCPTMFVHKQRLRVHSATIPKYSANRLRHPAFTLDQLRTYLSR